MDQETAQQLFYRYAVLLLLDAPDGLEFGIDYNSWTIGPRFQGVKMIPPGIHLIYYSVTDKVGQSGLRNGNTVRRWNLDTEDFEPIDAIKGDVSIHYRDQLRNYDPNLAPYPLESKTYTIWRQLSNYISPDLARRILPSNQRILDITQPDEHGIELPDSSADTTTLKGFTPIEVRRSYREGTTGSELTRNMLDKTWLLQSIIKQHFNDDYKGLLGEMQLAFILLLLAHNYSGLEQWKRITHLICGSEQALSSMGNTLYVDFLQVLQHQLQECPHDFFYDLLSSDNFISVLLKTLFSNVAQQRDTTSNEYPSNMNNLIEQITEFRLFLQDKFGWVPPFEEEEELEEGEDAPVIVEL
ncbi:A1 cistron-splicing factor [Syncephalis fuscata]|nr:A1 cistron-splicing factor [Syncephalis fuscata]